MSADDFRGKFVILDFWNKGCVSCVQSFPKLNQLHSKFKDRVSIILVGTEEEGIEAKFEVYRKKLSLEFPFVFNFPLYNRFVPSGAPHLVWMDASGITQAITVGEALNDTNIEAFLEGRPFEFEDRSHSAFSKRDAYNYDSVKPYLINGNGGDGNDFLYRSLLAKYKAGMPERPFQPQFVPGLLIQDGDKTLIEGVADLLLLYKMAYTGNMEWRYGDSIYSVMYNHIILEVKDTSAFYSDKETAEGYYWYSLIIPSAKATGKYIMKGMQRDLQYYFGYEVKIEARVFDYLKLEATDKARKTLMTKGGVSSVKTNYASFKGSNIPLDRFFGYIFGLYNYGMPIINDTGMESNVDMDINVVVTEWTDVKRLLTELGFTLTKARKEFKVIVVTDQKD